MAQLAKTEGQGQIDGLDQMDYETGGSSLVTRASWREGGGNKLSGTGRNFPGSETDYRQGLAEGCGGGISPVRGRYWGRPSLARRVGRAIPRISAALVLLPPTRSSTAAM